jgi:hypothetical protein
VIRVASPIAEPAEFDAQCRKPGQQWIVGHPQPEGRPPDYWSRFRDDLREGFVRRCGYFAMFMHDGAVDHFVPWDTCKEDFPVLAYEWDNFRFIAPSLNSKKGTLYDELLDPFEVQDDWFAVEIPSFVLRITDRIPPSLRAKAEFTLDRLDLQQGRKAVTLRWEWYEQHRLGELTLAGLHRNAPLVARAVEKWERDGKGALPAVPRPVP